MKAPKTNQEVFDRVCAHLRAQKTRSESNGHCLYRSEDGLKCAVGCLIPDEHYNPKFERGSVSVLTGYHGLKWMLKFEPLLNRLQSVHDKNPPSDWETALRRAAEDYEVTYVTP